MILDDYLHYADPVYINGGKAVARVRVFEQHGKTVIVLTELFYNPGPSITNASAAVVAAVHERFGKDVVIVEHYPRVAGIRETFTRVDVAIDGSLKNNMLSSADMIQLIGNASLDHELSDEPESLKKAFQNA